ncbi:MAG: tRNA 2-thiocytidine biosynthesis protein TtcA [Ruminococcaceae bacterium]|nr:tRNA 2-thiocytidine biosynthesis protein TtcA [Oscillospiraceae bacterium]
MEKHTEVERSIIKKYRKEIWKRFIAGINEYEMIKPGDRIAVCISGGKDSMLLAKCIQHLQKHSDFPFEAKYLVLDPGYSPENRQRIIDNAKTLDVPIEIFDANIFGYVVDVEDSPCYLCARMRRGHLYKNAQLMGCNKIALGHHFDDVIETILLSMIYGAEIKTMMPKLHSTNFEGMELIRPLYMVREADINAWVRYNGLTFLQCACKFTEASQSSQSDKELLSKRKEMKELISSFRKINSNIEMNIFRSVHNVNLETVIGYHKGDVKYNFLDDYDE